MSAAVLLLVWVLEELELELLQQEAPHSAGWRDPWPAVVSGVTQAGKPR